MGRQIHFHRLPEDRASRIVIWATNFGANSGIMSNPMKIREKVVGAKGFEPSTSWSRTRRASQAALRPDSLQRIRQRIAARIIRISQPSRIGHGLFCYSPRPTRSAHASTKKQNAAAIKRPRRRLPLKFSLLEAVSQREFHHSRPSQRLRVLSESTADIDFRKHTERIEAHRVRDVIHAPVEGDFLSLRQAPALV